MSEAKEQSLLFKWAELQKSAIPALDMLFAIPNGGSRNPIEAVNLKRQGLKSGVPDMFLAYPNKNYAGLFIELKFGENKPSKNQNEWIEKLNKAGYLCVVAYGFDEAKSIITSYLK